MDDKFPSCDDVFLSSLNNNLRRGPKLLNVGNIKAWGNLKTALCSGRKCPEGLTNINSPWASYQIRKIAGCACAGNAGNVSPRRRFHRKPLVSDPGMHHGTCVTHVPWCMAGSLTCGDGESVPGIPGACAPAILRIWQEAHVDLVTARCIP